MFLRFLTGVLALVLLVFPLKAQAEVPSDVQLLRKIANMDVSRAQIPAFQKVFEQETLKQVDLIAKTYGYPAWFSSENPKIKSKVKAVIQTEVKRLTALGSSPQMNKFALKVISGRLAQDVMAQSVMAPVPKTVQSVASRSFFSGGVRLQGAGTRSASNTYFYPVMRDSVISQERGGFGAGNGVLDPGEMAMLKFAFINVSPNRLYSTSVYVEKHSECIWVVGGGDEYELEELDRHESASIDLVLYLSQDGCSTAPSVTLKAYDSRYFAQTPWVFEYVFPIATAVDATLVDVRLDMDDYGHSEPTKAPLPPSAEVELSAGIATMASGFTHAHQKFIVPAPLKSSHDAQFTGMTSRLGRASVALPVDDVDIEVPGKAALERGLRSAEQRMGWEDPKDAILFVAVDSTLMKGPPSDLSSDSPSSTSNSTLSINAAAVGATNSKSADVAAVNKAAEAPIAYNMRHYIELPVQWAPTIEPEPESEPEPEPEPEPAPVVEKSRRIIEDVEDEEFLPFIAFGVTRQAAGSCWSVDIPDDVCTLQGASLTVGGSKEGANHNSRKVEVVFGLDYARNAYESHRLVSTVLRAGGAYLFKLSETFFVGPQLEMGLPAIHPSQQAEADAVAYDSRNLEQVAVIPSIRLVAEGRDNYVGFLQLGRYLYDVSGRYGPQSFITVGGTMLLGK